MANTPGDVQEVTVGDVVQGEAGQLAELSPISKSSRQSSALQRSELCIKTLGGIAGHHLKAQNAPYGLCLLVVSVISAELNCVPEREETFSDSKHQRVMEVRRGAMVEAGVR